MDDSLSPNYLKKFSHIFERKLQPYFYRLIERKNSQKAET